MECPLQYYAASYLWLKDLWHREDSMEADLFQRQASSSRKWAISLIQQVSFLDYTHIQGKRNLVLISQLEMAHFYNVVLQA